MNYEQFFYFMRGYLYGRGTVSTDVIISIMDKIDSNPMPSQPEPQIEMSESVFLNPDLMNNIPIENDIPDKIEVQENLKWERASKDEINI